MIFTKSEMAANRVMKSITDWIERKLFLKVNATKTKVVRPTRSKYLGFTFLKNGSEWKVRGWINYFRIGKMKQFMEEFGAWLRHKIRVQGLISTIMNAAGFGSATDTVLPQEIVTAVEDCGFFESIPPLPQHRP